MLTVKTFSPDRFELLMPLKMYCRYVYLPKYFQVLHTSTRSLSGKIRRGIPDYSSRLQCLPVCNFDSNISVSRREDKIFFTQSAFQQQVSRDAINTDWDYLQTPWVAISASRVLLSDNCVTA